MQPLLSSIPLAVQTPSDLVVLESFSDLMVPESVSGVVGPESAAGSLDSVSVVKLSTEDSSPVNVPLAVRALTTSSQPDEHHKAWKSDENRSLLVAATELSLSADVERTLQQLEQERHERECCLSEESLRRQASVVTLQIDHCIKLFLQLMTTQVALEARIVQQRSLLAAREQKKVSKCYCVCCQSVLCER